MNVILKIILVLCLTVGSLQLATSRHKKTKKSKMNSQVYSNFQHYQSTLSYTSVNCQSKYSTPEEIRQCKLNVLEGRQTAVYKIWAGFIVGLTLFLLLVWRNYQCGYLRQFYSKYSELQYKGNSIQQFDQVLKQRRRLIVFTSDMPNSSNCFEMTGSHERKNMYRIRIESVDCLCQFSCDGYMSFGDQIRVAFTKKYANQSFNQRGKFMIFKGIYKNQQFQGDWYYEGCQMVIKMHGKWKTKEMEKGKYYC